MSTTSLTKTAEPSDWVPQNPQEFYDHLVKTSEAGGFPSMDFDRGLCKFRSPSGRKCVVGHLIPDSRYDEDMEKNGCADDFYAMYPELLPPWASGRQLRQAQLCHDDQYMGDVIERATRPWNHERFVADLNKLDLFKDCEKVIPA